jgi:hypothetical protein
MTVAILLREAERLGITLTVEGNRLHVRAPTGVLTPELQAALTVHKPQLMRRLAAPPPDQAGGSPCSTCGMAEWWRWLDGRLLCRPCLIREDPLLAEMTATAAAKPPRHRRQWW